MSTLKTYLRETGYTHFTPVGRGQYRVYDLTRCEACGEEFEAPNGCKIAGPGINEASLKAAGLVSGNHEELAGYDDRRDMAVCSGCYSSYPDRSGITPDPDSCESAMMANDSCG